MTVLQGKTVTNSLIPTTALESFYSLTRGDQRIIEAIRLVLVQEVKSLKIQKQEGISRTQLWKICLDKGGATGVLIAQIIHRQESEPDIEIASQIGQAVQIVDDLLDINEDQEDQIMTVPRWDLNHDRKLDYHLNEVIVELSKIPNRFNVIKVMLLIMTLHAVSKYRQHFSRLLVRRIDPYIYFDARLGVELREIGRIIFQSFNFK